MLLTLRVKAGKTQVHARAIDEFRRDAVKKLEEFIGSWPSVPREQKAGGYIH